MKRDFKKYKYSELDYKAASERSCYTPGRVYVYGKVVSGSPRGIKEGDLLLCIRKSGDCFYNFIRIQYRTRTGDSKFESLGGIPTYKLWNYYDVLEKFNSYGGMKEAFPNMETLSELDLIHTLYSKQVLIPYLSTMTTKELDEEEKIWEAEEELHLRKVKRMINNK